MTKRAAIFIWLSVLAISAAAQEQVLVTLTDQISEPSLKTNLQKIAGPETEGRMPATHGDDLTIQYIAAWFQTHHLTNPYSASAPFLQSVPLLIVDLENSALSTGDKPYTLHKDWSYLEEENPGSIPNAEVVFIGYGLSVPAYDDLKDIDIEGKLVLYQPGSPMDPTGKPWVPESQVPDYTTILKDIQSKKPLGVLIYIRFPIPTLDSIRQEYKAQFPYQGLPTPGPPTLSGAVISKDLADAILGCNIDSVYDRINQSGKPHSFNTHHHATLSIVEKDDRRQSANIVGTIQGTDTSQGAIVITAHHDHFGIIKGKTYYGADDNGTGTVAMMEIVKVLGDAATTGIRPKRTLVFVSTTAEEQGLIGSAWYVDHPVIPLTRTYCDVNLDMFGRVDSFYSGKRPDSSYVYAIYRNFPAEKLKAVNDACCHLLLDTLYNKRKNPKSFGLMGRADALPFIKHDIPAVWFFGGYHYDYHQPTDTWDKIDYPLLKRRTTLALAIIWRLANE